MQPAIDYAVAVRDQLERRNARIVLAESCTAGRIAATLGEIPGISQWLCGCFVIYRNASKAAWLGISRSVLDDPRIGPVSAQVTEQLAQSALAHTPEAQFGFAITGDIGPGAPALTDGTAFCCLASRAQIQFALASTTLQLKSPAPRDTMDFAARRTRLTEASQLALAFLAEQLAGDQ